MSQFIRNGLVLLKDIPHYSWRKPVQKFVNFNWQTLNEYFYDGLQMSYTFEEVHWKMIGSLSCSQSGYSQDSFMKEWRCFFISKLASLFVTSLKINPFCNDYSQSDVLQNLCSKLKTMTDHITGNQEKNRNYCCRINSTFLLYIILKGILDIYIATIGYMLLYRKMLIFA